MSENWLERWDNGRTGWHEKEGNAGLHAHWPELPSGTRVLVPLAGKTPDMLWLAGRGCRVTGIELSPVAVEAFFSDNGLSFTKDDHKGLQRYTAADHTIEIYCGDYFNLSTAEYDALYDRGALVALPAETRARYVEHTNTLLKMSPVRLVVTLEYDQEIVAGPPFSVSESEILGYWPDLVRVGEKDDIETCPPKFIAAGLTDIREVIWLSGASPSG